MIWINYIFRVPIAAICTIVVGVVIFIIAALCAIFVNWQEGWPWIKAMPKDGEGFFREIAGLK